MHVSVPELLARLDHERPTPIRRSAKRLPNSRERSLELEGLVEIPGGVFLPIAGFARARSSSKPLLILIVGGVIAAVGNGVILLGGFGGLIYNVAATVGIMSPFVGWSYKVRANEGRLADTSGSAPGILALADEVILHYPDRNVSIPRTQITGVAHRTSEEMSGDGEHMIILHELLVYTGAQTHVAWRLTQYSGSLDNDLDAAAASMPAIAGFLERRLGIG